MHFFTSRLLICFGDVVDHDGVTFHHISGVAPGMMLPCHVCSEGSHILEPSRDGMRWPFWGDPFFQKTIHGCTFLWTQQVQVAWSNSLAAVVGCSTRWLSGLAIPQNRMAFELQNLRVFHSDHYFLPINEGELQRSGILVISPPHPKSIWVLRTINHSPNNAYAGPKGYQRMIISCSIWLTLLSGSP